ncbi:MAG: hypothetical protein R2834_13785 [Rhodothermales bacterium]
MDTQNPLSELISDELYDMLASHSLLSDKGIRDYQIRMKFRMMRDNDVPACDAIEQLRNEYPYLQFDTVRKIVYKLNGKK